MYNLEGLKVNHPVGYQVVNSVKNKEMDRYLYGMYTSETSPGLPLNSHSFKSMDLLGEPIGVLSVQSPYAGFSEQPMDVQLKSVSLVSERGKIYQLKVVPKNVSQDLSFSGYSDVAQLGRYFSLSLNNKVTRLYTSVNFLDSRNLQLLQRVFFIPNRIQLR